MKSFFAALAFLLAILACAPSASARDGINRAGRQHRTYMLGLHSVFQRAKDSKLTAMGRTRWELRQQRRDVRRFNR